MAQKKDTSSTQTQMNFNELQQWYEKNHRTIEMFANNQLPKTLRDVSRGATKNVSTLPNSSIRESSVVDILIFISRMKS